MAEEMATHDTGDEKHYRYKPFAGQTLRFLVKAAHDCHISFTTEEGESDPMYEVFLGGWEGQYSAVRFKKTDDLVKESTPDILSADEFREFWIATDHNEVRVGKGGEYAPFLSCSLPEPLNPTFFGFSTGWGATGAFQFFHERDIATEDKLEYRYEPLYGDTFTFTVTCDHDAHLGFTMGPEHTPLMYEVFIGGWSNQNSAIRKNKETTVIKVPTPDECCGAAKTYWVNLRGGHVRVGRQGETDPFMEWQDPEPFKVTHVGVCTGWGACGQWKLDV
uniref:Farnesoic acid O-methyltransferase n=1 Tax=Gammarus pulex TaxID=52641 RepID=A0A481NV27_9CRUS|nr:farnesoic acid O-methyltransferase [Gammarus pulex]